ncbi:MAG TPA: signal peptidase I [Mucilaginibacter sp.]|jgi:signal peptidase I
MRKAAIIFACLGVLYWTLRLTDILYIYRVPSNYNLPTMAEGKIIFASRLKPIKYNQFIVFKKPKYDIMIFRCIGMPGDIIEIKDGSVYRNSKLLSENFTINDYLITQKQLSTIKKNITEKNYLVPLSDTLNKVTLTGLELKTYHLSLPPYISKKGDTSADICIYADFKKKRFNKDNLGPIKIPANSYFLLGDERPYAFDSRYIGFIKKSEIISTVLGH